MISPKSILASLNACSKRKDLCKGSRIHEDIIKGGFLQKDVYIGSALINLYAKCGSFAKAQEVFEQLPIRNVVTWTTLIMGYANHGHGEEAIHCYDKMVLERSLPNMATFVCVLKACSLIGAIDKGQEIHSQIVRTGSIDQHLSAANSLLDMYAKCGEVSKSEEVFDKIRTRDVITWTALMSGHAQHGCFVKAISGFDRMHCEGICPNSFTFVCFLKACGSEGLVQKSKEIHARIIGVGLVSEKDDLVGSALIDVYAKYGSLSESQKVFDLTRVHDVVSWTVLISGYAKRGWGWEALCCFEAMRNDGVMPTVVTLFCILKACASIGAIGKGEEFHAQMIREGLLESNAMLSTGLIEMYAACGMLGKAQEVFDSLRHKDLVSWTVLISGYAHHEQCEEALFRFEQMQSEGLSPDAFTFTAVLKSCGKLGAIQKGRNMHVKIIKEGLFDKDYMVANALIDNYAMCGALGEAQWVFDEIQDRDAGSWSILIAGYIQHGYEEEALDHFKRMRNTGLFPDAFTFRCILKACAILGAVEKGEEIHFLVIKAGLLEGDVLIGNALVDMYAKCGVLAKAQEAFEELGQARNVVSWTALMSGYSQMGEDETVINLCNRMMSESIEPNAVTFNVILNACSHQGRLEKGQMYFRMMSRTYGIIPSLEHHTCIADLLSRAGRFHEAVEVIQRMPTSDYLPVWASLLGSCQKWGNFELGKVAFEHAIQLDEGNATTYIYMSNLCLMKL